MSTSTKPNIILINCDDLGYGDLGCYGSTTHRTPALDAMAEGGVRLTDFYMASPVCSPSRGAMMTGCYPRRIGFGNFEGKWVLFPGQPVGLSTDEVTVAGLLRGQGYATKIVGKWHCGDQPEFLPTRHGFDSYYGIPFSNDMGRQGAGDQSRPPLPLLRDEEVIEQQPDQRGITERYTEECVRFLRENRDGPFFLYLAHMHVHLPLYAAQRFVDRSLNGPYGACVEAIDWSTAVLMHELRRLGLDRNTLVVFTSDNGGRAKEGGSNAPLSGAKGSCWEGGQRVPCIAYMPGTIPAGQTCAEVATSMDLLPTFATMAGTTAPQDRIIDGKDIGPLLRGEAGAKSPHEAFLYYFRDTLNAVRSGRWKLYVARGLKDPATELYDLQADVAEKVNLYDQRPDIVAALMKHVEAARADLGDEAVGAPGANCRPIGRVEQGRTLTQYDPNHPYIEAEYDLLERG